MSYCIVDYLACAKRDNEAVMDEPYGSVFYLNKAKYLSIRFLR